MEESATLIFPYQVKIGTNLPFSEFSQVKFVCCFCFYTIDFRCYHYAALLLKILRLWKFLYEPDKYNYHILYDTSSLTTAHSLDLVHLLFPMFFTTSLSSLSSPVFLLPLAHNDCFRHTAHFISGPFPEWLYCAFK